MLHTPAARHGAPGRRGVHFPLTISLSPPLVAMLGDGYYRRKFADYLDCVTALARAHATPDGGALSAALSHLADRLGETRAGGTPRTATSPRDSGCFRSAAPSRSSRPPPRTRSCPRTGSVPRSSGFRSGPGRTCSRARSARHRGASGFPKWAITPGSTGFCATAA